MSSNLKTVCLSIVIMNLSVQLAVLNILYAIVSHWFATVWNRNVVFTLTTFFTNQDFIFLDMT